VLAELEGAGISVFAVPWLAGAYRVSPTDRDALLASEPYRKGWLYVQNLSSMLPVEALDPEPEDRVLDLCAAPGGKTLQLAARVRSPAQVLAVEKVRARYYKLRANLMRFGASQVRTRCMDGRVAGRLWPGAFARVLVDAPCSSEARFRPEDPETYRYWSLPKVHAWARLGAALLESGLQALQPGGRLVFATCTFAPEENEAVLAAVLERQGPVVELEPISWPFPNQQPGLLSWRGRRFPEAVRLATRVLPTPEMEGFFVAVLRKRAPVGRKKGRR